jgi:type VI secretion system protein ImpK
MRLAPLPPDAARALAEFRRFYAELVAVKRLLGRPGLPGPDAEAADRPAMPPLREAFARLYATVHELRRQGAGPRRTEDIDTGYVMAALADETVLGQLDAAGRDAWTPMLLEDALYGSRVAGERIFELAEAAAAGRPSGRLDLTATLLMSLLAGFRGRYRDQDDGGAVRALAVRLYERLHEQPWQAEVPWRPALVAHAEVPAAQRALTRLPALRPWLAALAGLVVLYVVAAHIVWRQGVADMLTLADAIVERRVAAD